jgi:hypothetical protein
MQMVAHIHGEQCGGFIHARNKGFGRCGLCCTDCALFLCISLFFGYKKAWLVALVAQSRRIIQQLSPLSPPESKGGGSPDSKNAKRKRPISFQIFGSSAVFPPEIWLGSPSSILRINTIPSFGIHQHGWFSSYQFTMRCDRAASFRNAFDTPHHIPIPTRRCQGTDSASSKPLGNRLHHGNLE